MFALKLKFNNIDVYYEHDKFYHPSRNCSTPKSEKSTSKYKRSRSFWTLSDVVSLLAFGMSK